MNLVGTTLGQFQIVEELGRGGMATVYKAYQASLHRHVALKVLAPALAQDMDVVKRFLREAQTAAALRHPNVITIYDVGSDEDVHYIVAEYLEGCTLAQLLDSEGSALPLARILHVVRQISDALDYAHARGFVHRDIKPSNIMIDPARDDHVTLMDFGLVQVASGSRITRTGYIVGTPDYMSPEQAKGDVIDQRTDVYSLGVTTFHMITGNVPFPRPTPHAVLLAHVMEEPPTMSSVGSVTPPEVEAVVLKSMAKDPNDRYEWASDLANDLETAITAVDIAAADFAARYAEALETEGATPGAPAWPGPPSRAQESTPDRGAPAAGETPSSPSAPPVHAPAPAPERFPGAAPSPPTRATGAAARSRPKWLWPVVGVGALGALIVLILACALSIPVINRLVQGTPVPTHTLVPTTDSEGDVRLTRGAPWYEEDFSAPDAEWEISESAEASYRVDGEAYSIEVTKEHWIAWHTIGQELQDFEIELDVSLVEGDPANDAGLLFRFQDADNYYEVDIDGEGRFAVGKEVNNEWTQLVEWTYDPDIHPFGQANRVRLVAQGNQFTLYVNNEFSTYFEDDSFASGGIGPVVTAYDQPPARATFDNIRIWPIEQE
jgi:tRNA A-37 threonylcarbamoyl transferase component Bud32